MNEKEKKTWLDFGFFEIPYEVAKEYAELKPVMLLERLIKSLSYEPMPKDKYVEATIVNSQDDEYLIKWFYNHYLYDVMEASHDRVYELQIKPLEDNLNDLGRHFNSHRHDKDKSYTDKPVWG